MTMHFSFSNISCYSHKNPVGKKGLTIIHEDREHRKVTFDHTSHLHPSPSRLKINTVRLNGRLARLNTV